MKISIITIHRVLNYGTVLQAFATQEVIKKMGHQVEIIDYITEVRKPKDIFMAYPKNLSKNFLKRLFYILIRIPSNALKFLTFNSFIKNNYQLSKRKYISIIDLKKNPPDADAYIVGSDQVWNSKYNEMVDEGFFLEFGNDSILKLSYASSFGGEFIEEDESIKVKGHLEKFNAISVREKSGKKIIENMNLNSSVVLDPTLVLSKSEWGNYLSPKIINNRKKYLLLFLIYNEDNNATKYARKIADEKGLEVVQLNWKPFKKDGVDKIVLYKTPFEFLRYIRDADFVVTNSFHGTAFAINFNKEFITVARKEFNTRLENILEDFNLKDRYVEKEFEVSNLQKTINYDEVNNKLDEKRLESNIFLSKSLELKSEER